MMHICIAGNIGTDAVTRTAGNDTVTSWSVACDEKQGDGTRRTIWFDVSLWGKRGVALAPYLTKGSKVAVAGQFSARERDGRTWLSVRADAVTLQGGGKEPQRDAPASPPATTPPTQPLDDEIPF